MKRFLRIFSVSILIIIMTINTSALSAYIGDINLNSKIEASDARTVLRASVGLEAVSDELFAIADIDKDGKLSASDARIILRMSVGLEELIYAETPQKGLFEAHFIDVGQADCALIICDDQALLIDGGNAEDSELIIDYISSQDIDEIDYIICTHAHEDHIGGISDIIEHYTITECIFTPEADADTDCYNAFINSAEKNEIEIISPENGYSFSLGSSTVEFIGPVHESYQDINNTSLVTKITFDETAFLFTGDAERESEADIIASGADLSADVLKVGHHGSENSTSYRFLREIMPEIAVISVGKNNSYSHPTKEVLSRLKDADVSVYRTDLNGHIIIRSDGKSLTVTTDKKQTENNNSEVKPDTEYIGNLNSKKLHLPTCSSLPKEENRIYFSYKDQATSLGYTPCAKCKP